MPRDGRGTRTAIMDAAETLILDQGFAATSVERIIAAAGVTKGTFFHHFPSKADLARAIVERYAEADRAHLEDGLARAEGLSRDPLQQVLIFVGLMREQALGLDAEHPGCLFASYCYQAQLFDEGTLRVITDALDAWRRRLGAKLAEAVQRHPPRLPADPDDLADMLTVVFEGAFVLARTRKEAAVVATQLGLYRDYLDLLFGAREAVPPTEGARF